MNGTPIPGAHWLIIDLGKKAQLSRVVLDWETAFAKGYDIDVSDLGQPDSPDWKPVYTTRSASAEQASPKHVVHSVVLGGGAWLYRLAGGRRGRRCWTTRCTRTGRAG
eukprot:COSAG05_NODE_14752_length_388_cov_0.598616_1_plen_107_part_10